MGVCPHLFSHHNYLKTNCELVHCWIGDSLCWSHAAYIKSLHLRAFLDHWPWCFLWLFVLYCLSVWTSPDKVQLIHRCDIVFSLHKLYLYRGGASSPVSLCSWLPWKSLVFPPLHLKNKIKKCCCFLHLPFFSLFWMFSDVLIFLSPLESEWTSDKKSYTPKLFP